MTVLEANHPAHDTLSAACNKALGYHVQGHLDLAEQVYRAVLEIAPKHGMANYALGMLLLQAGTAEAAMPFLQDAIGSEPRNLEYWQGYIEALIKAGRLEMARQIVKVAEAYGLDNAAGAQLNQRLGHDRMAARLPVKAAKRQPLKGLTPSRHRLQQIDHLIAAGNRDEALFLARLLTQEFPQHGFGWKVVGAIQATRHEQALTRDTIDALHRAADLLPNDTEANFNYLYGLARTDQGSVLRGRLEAFVARHPNHANAVGLLGAEICKEGGAPQEALQLLRRALRLNPTSASIRSALLFLLLELPDPDPATILAEHRQFDQIHGAQWAKHWPRHDNDRTPERCIRIGLVSGDMYDHSVAYFIEPILAGLASNPQYSLHVYYNNTRTDAMTDHLKGLVSHWRDVYWLTDEALAQRIRQDHIDILVDLSGHTALNRLLTFARKPAPLQVSWIGYPGTTGMQAIDYLLGDPYYLPPGRFDDQFTEALVRLPASDPYRPPAITPDINQLPALTNGYLTFATLNRPSKITRQAVAVWARVLASVPTARLVVGHLPEGVMPQRLAEAFAAEGISADRLICHGKYQMEGYLKLHHQIDLCLDTFPYNGGTTVNTAIWMGVPTLTIAGATPAGHQAAACLLKLGLNRFVAQDADGMVAEAQYWATHLAELDALRAGMRERVRATPGRQAPVIVAGLDRAFRTMWRMWCAGKAPTPFSVADAD